MRSFTIRENDAGQRMDKFITKAVPLLPKSLMYKYLRLKRIKLNGKRCEISTRLTAGDVVEMYIGDEFFDTAPEESFRFAGPMVPIVYEDEHLLLVNKRPGLVVHPDETERVNTLITHIQAYLYQKKEWSPYQEGAFAPALCNRIDRNTGGIVIAAKTAEGLRVMNQKIRDRELKKYYLCIVHGTLPRPAGRLEGYILKDEAKKQVTVSSRPRPGAKTAVTLYETLAVRNGLSLVRCQLITGRTHQIRAQFAAAGHPLLGDGKYGSERQNKRYGRSYQALYSYRLEFCFTTDAGALAPLDGQQFQVEQVDFVTEYFPGFSL